ncbi:MAG TPA: serine/threonine-protein kinase [Casimicrobium sp.]|nr:serine/threonine-protein kinase [Casimicrobium sp.]
MQLSHADLRELGQCADRWLAASEAERDALRSQAVRRGGAFAEAFTAMVEQLVSEHDHAVLTPIPAAMRDAALSASIEQSKARSAAGDDDTFRFDSVFGHNTAFGRTLTPPERAAGQHIGPYRLIRELGRGGMGVVWLAERADGQHTRQVALKMPLVENLNWLLAARFARERNILASLEHPGIARLYDAGVDNHNHSSQPYIAIEYVQGQPITSYVRDKKLKPEATVQLFTKVIEAVAHAHTQLIIHRDIKPSNILVDAKGEPHLLDFGIAKLLDDEDSNAIDATQLTKLSGRALTLDYASPEQVNNASLGTASDVYSLGVVLYELLTGTRPYHPKGPTRRDLEQAILEQDPQKPSEQLLTQTTGNSETGKSARRMRGDLDTIVLKALRKDPKQRYATAQAFADDLKRYIGFEPIAAKPDDAWYRVTRFVRRHRLAVTLVASAVMSLTVFSALIARESAMHRRTTEFLLQALTPTSYYTDGGGVLSHAELLKRAADGVTTKFADSPRAASELYEAIGESLFNLGAHEDAFQVRTRAQPGVDAVFGRTSREAVRNAGRATYMHLTQRRFPEFLKSMDDLRARCPSLDTLPLPHCYTYIWMQTEYYAYTGEGHKRHSLWQQYDARITPSVDAKSRWHTLLNYWGAGGARQAGDLRASRERWKKLLELPETQSGALGEHMTALAICLYLTEAGFYADAAALSREVYAQGERWMGASFDPHLFYVPGVAIAQATAGVDGVVEASLREGIARAQSRAGATADQETADAREALALWLIGRGRYAEAVEPLEHAIRLQRARGAAYNQYVTQMQVQRAVLDVLLESPATVDTARGEAISRLLALREDAAAIPDQSTLPRIDATLAALERDTTRAEAHWKRALDAMQRSDLRPGDTALLLRLLGSTRQMPAAVEDDVVASMRAYVQKVLAVTQREIAKREKPGAS